jgi:sorting nexin-4
MAVIDQDNFSNISWHSEQAARGQSSSSAAEDNVNDPAARNGHQDMDPELDPAGLGAEVLDCVVSHPVKEGDGTKDAFVSYQISTHVCRRLMPYQAPHLLELSVFACGGVLTDLRKDY